MLRATTRMPNTRPVVGKIIRRWTNTCRWTRGGKGTPWLFTDLCSLHWGKDLSWLCPHPSFGLNSSFPALRPAWSFAWKLLLTSRSLLRCPLGPRMSLHSLADVTSPCVPFLFWSHTKVHSLPLDYYALFCSASSLGQVLFVSRHQSSFPTSSRVSEEPPPAGDKKREGGRGGAKGTATLIGQRVLPPPTPREGFWEESSRWVF